MISTEYTHAVGYVLSVDVTVLLCVSMLKHCCWAFRRWAASCGVSPAECIEHRRASEVCGSDRVTCSVASGHIAWVYGLHSCRHYLFT